MRSRKNSIITKEEISRYSENWLSTALRLDYEGRPCTTSVLFRILLIAAGRVVSVFAACRDLADVPCSRTVYDVLLAILPEIRELQKRLNRSLCHELPQAHAPRVTSGPFSDDSAPKNSFGDPVIQASPALLRKSRIVAIDQFVDRLAPVIPGDFFVQMPPDSLDGVGFWGVLG